MLLLALQRPTNYSESYNRLGKIMDYTASTPHCEIATATSIDRTIRSIIILPRELRLRFQLDASCYGS